MRNIVKYILKNLIAGHITDADAIKQLQVLFANSKYLSDEKNMLPIGKKRLHKIIAADGDKCFYCGVKTYRHGNDRKDDSSTVDHVLPIKMGGIDHIDNCVNACHWCNNQKGSDRLVPINTFINFSLSQKTLKPASANVKTAK